MYCPALLSGPIRLPFGTGSRALTNDSTKLSTHTDAFPGARFCIFAYGHEPASTGFGTKLPPAVGEQFVNPAVLAYPVPGALPQVSLTIPNLALGARVWPIPGMPLR